MKGRGYFQQCHQEDLKILIKQIVENKKTVRIMRVFKNFLTIFKRLNVTSFLPMIVIYDASSEVILNTYSDDIILGKEGLGQPKWTPALNITIRPVIKITNGVYIFMSNCL